MSDYSLMLPELCNQFPFVGIALIDVEGHFVEGSGLLADSASCRLSLSFDDKLKADDPSSISSIPTHNIKPALNVREVEEIRLACFQAIFNLPTSHPLNAGLPNDAETTDELRSWSSFPNESQSHTTESPLATAETTITPLESLAYKDISKLPGQSLWLNDQQYTILRYSYTELQAITKYRRFGVILRSFGRFYMICVYEGGNPIANNDQQALHISRSVASSLLR